jgi:hypothetical protein
MVIDRAVLEKVSDELQAYVYMLVDPDSEVPFYVGKGHRLRHGDHVAQVLASMTEALNPWRNHPRRNLASVLPGDMRFHAVEAVVPVRHAASKVG